MVSNARVNPALSLLAPAWRARLGSILAVAPLSIWVANHLFENLLLWRSREAWQQEVTGASGPVQEALISFFVLGPLVIHTVWGLARIKRTRPNFKSWPTFENLRFLLQRVSALCVLLFVGAHLTMARIKPFFEYENHHIPLADFAAHMKTAPTFITYVLGTLAVTYHLANGIWGFAIHMGWYQGPQAQRRLRNACIAFFVVLQTAAWASIFALVTRY